MSDIVLARKRVDFKLRKRNMGQKVTHIVSSAPDLKHKDFFLLESAQKERIQPTPVDLCILCHFVPICTTLHYTQSASVSACKCALTPLHPCTSCTSCTSCPSCPSCTSFTSCTSRPPQRWSILTAWFYSTNICRYM